jgi:hypothetical protein
MPSRHNLSSYQRRCRRADLILSLGVPVMRPCQSCVSARLLCVVSSASEHCEQCVRRGRTCELAPPDREITRLDREQKELFDKASAAKAVAAQALAKANRYTKQRRLALKRIKELGRREDQNILELEVDEMLTDGAAVVGGLEMDESLLSEPLVPLVDSPSGALNSPSPRPFSFLDPALLGSPDRTVEVSQSNS